MKTLLLLFLVGLAVCVVRSDHGDGGDGDGDGISAADSFTIFLHNLPTRYHNLSEEDKLFLAELVMAAELKEVPELLTRVGHKPLDSLKHHLNSSDRHMLDTYLHAHHS